MKRILGVLAAVVAVSVLVWVAFESSEEAYSSYASQPETPEAQQSADVSFTYNFDSDAVGAMPAKFHSARTGKGPESKWAVMADPTAPSKPNVVVQTSTDATDYRFPLLIADEGSFKDLELSVKFKAVSGEVDRAGGLIFRLKDANKPPSICRREFQSNFRGMARTARGGCGQQDHLLLRRCQEDRSDGRHVQRCRQGGSVDQGRLRNLFR